MPVLPLVESRIVRAVIQFAGTLAVQHHVECGAILDAAAGIEVLRLAENLDARKLQGDFLKAQQGRIADRRKQRLGLGARQMGNGKSVGHNHLIRFSLRLVGCGYCIPITPISVKKGGNGVKRRNRGSFPSLDYNTLIMFHRQRFLSVSAWLLAAAVLVPASFAQTKRPLNHGDYDGWRSIVGQHLSNDGKFLVYGLFPQEGDGEVVIRNLVTGKEQREPAGQRPAPTPPTPGEEGPAPEARGAVLEFSADSKTVVFSTFPPKAETDKAKKDKKPAPKDGMVIVDLASGKATRVERVKRFAMPEKAVGPAGLLKEGPDVPAGAAGSAPEAARRRRAISRAAAADAAERRPAPRAAAPPSSAPTWSFAICADSLRAHLHRRRGVHTSPTTASTGLRRRRRTIPRRTASSPSSPAPPMRPSRCSTAKASTPS